MRNLCRHLFPVLPCKTFTKFLLTKLLKPNERSGYLSDRPVTLDGQVQMVKQCFTARRRDHLAPSTPQLSVLWEALLCVTREAPTSCGALRGDRCGPPATGPQRRGGGSRFGERIHRFYSTFNGSKLPVGSGAPADKRSRDFYSTTYNCTEIHCFVYFVLASCNGWVEAAPKWMDPPKHSDDISMLSTSQEPLVASCY